MPVDTKQYAIAKLFNVRLFDLETVEKMLASMRNLKNTTFNSEGTVTYSTGGRNSVQTAAFDTEARAMLTIENAHFEDSVWAIQNGTDVQTITTGTEINIEERLTVTSNSAITTYTASGTVDEEIKFVYIANADGSQGTELTQVSGVPTTGEFSYVSGTRTLTFFAGDVPDGGIIILNYYPTVTNYKKISKSINLGSKIVKVIADGLFQDICTGENYAGQLVIYKGKVSPSFEIALTEASDPAVQGFEVNALSNCTNENLYDIFIYDEDDITV